MSANEGFDFRYALISLLVRSVVGNVRSLLIPNVRNTFLTAVSLAIFMDSMLDVNIVLLKYICDLAHLFLSQTR